jgi:formylglycine-generating enzyme required for sulfatase activity/predicted Ser/Thr protein kinase
MSQDEGSDRSRETVSEDSLLSDVAHRLLAPGGEEAWPVRPSTEADDRYELGDRLGQGGMGIVYRAFDKVLSRTVAIKLLREEDPLTTERFLREARAQAKVEHEHICHIYEVGTLSGRPFIAMQYVAGEPLGAARGQMSLEEKVRVVRDAALAVHAAHRVGLIHRDLKPSNILVEHTAAGWRPYVMDFGIAREASANALTMTGQVMGTPQYMSPEQALGRTAEIDRRTDVYALGATLYELLTQKPPFTGATAAEVLLKVIEGDPSPPRARVPGLPADLEAVVLRCLRKEPQERYDSARAFADDLGRYLAGEPVEARRTGLWYRIRKRARRNKALTVAVAVGVLATSSVGGVSRFITVRDRNARVASLFDEGGRARTEAASLRVGEEALRKRAFALFDAEKEREAEPVWAKAREARTALELAVARAGRAFEAALEIDPERRETREALADNLLERALLAERNRDFAKRDDLALRLKLYDEDGAFLRRWEASARLHIETRPAGAEVSLFPYVEAGGKLPLGEERRLGATPLAEIPLPHGSYLLRVAAPGRAPLRYPVLLGRGESLALSLHLPQTQEIPSGFVYIAPGRFLFGTATETERWLRFAPPLHESRTGGYLIGRTEVTVGEWLTFLETLPEKDRARLMPAADSILNGDIRLLEIGKGLWEYRFRLAGAKHGYAARTGEPFRHGGRRLRAIQDWMRFPVTGISFEDARAYTAWLNRSRRVIGARLCTGAEWERAARGADDREYPQGALPTLEEANRHDSYGDEGDGLDEVGSHPGSRSPFGLEDTVGNANEWTTPLAAGARTVWGRSFHDYAALLSVNTRQPATRDLRVPMGGFRVCATFSPASASKVDPHARR